MLSLSWLTVTSVWMPKTPYRIFVWDIHNKNSGSFLSIPHLELFGSQRIQCDRLELLHSNHNDPTSMLPSLCRNNQEHTRDISLLQDVRFSQLCCWEFKSSAMWCVVGRVVQVILQVCSAFIFNGQTEQEKLNLLWVPITCDTSRHWEQLVWRHSITTRGHKSQTSLLIQQKGVTIESEKNEYKFWAHGSVYHNSMLIKIQPDATVCRYLFTAKSLYIFLVSQHLSSGVLKIVTAASGTCHNTGTATCLQHVEWLCSK